jgi:hypothetical protein
MELVVLSVSLLGPTRFTDSGAQREEGVLEKWKGLGI